jgi:hypothetical protein
MLDKQGAVWDYSWQIDDVHARPKYSTQEEDLVHNTAVYQAIGGRWASVVVAMVLRSPTLSNTWTTK